MAEILIVEDDPLVVAMLRYCIDGAGHRTRTAGNVEEGWEALEDETPDAIILDISLPGATGWKLLEMLRADGRFHRIPVVVTTGLPDEEVREKANGLMADYLPKPYEPNDLLDRVHTIIKDAHLFFGRDSAPRTEKLVEVVPMSVVLLLDRYRIEGVVHLPPKFDRFSEAWEELMGDERAFIPVTSASVSLVSNGSEPVATSQFIEVRKSDIRALFGAPSNPRL